MSLSKDLRKGVVPRELVENWCDRQTNKHSVKRLLSAERWKKVSEWALVGIFTSIVLDVTIATFIGREHEHLVITIGVSIIFVSMATFCVSVLVRTLGNEGWVYNTFKAELGELRTALGNTGGHSVAGWQRTLDSKLIGISHSIQGLERLMAEKKDPDTVTAFGNQRKEQKAEFERILELCKRFGIDREPSFYFN